MTCLCENFGNRNRYHAICILIAAICFYYLRRTRIRSFLLLQRRKHSPFCGPNGAITCCIAASYNSPCALWEFSGCTLTSLQLWCDVMHHWRLHTPPGGLGKSSLWRDFDIFNKQETSKLITHIISFYDVMGR